LRHLRSGARAGVLFVIRNQLLRQSGLNGGQNDQAGYVLVSGSVPVQHRMPRPVPLPPNENREKALQPWASFFEPETNLLASSSPADEAFFAASGTAPARCLQMKLLEPVRGALTATWNGELVFEIRADSDGEMETIDVLEWVEVKIIDGDQTFDCKLENSEQPGHFRCVFDDAEAARKLLEGKLAGQILTANAYVGHDTHTAGFRQTLSLPLRIVDEARPPLPLAPYFSHFEDPEYNRRLSSPAAIAAGTFKDEDGNLQTVTLATDRREYNPDSRLALRFDFDEGITAVRKADLTFSRIDRNGQEIKLDMFLFSVGSELQSDLESGIFSEEFRQAFEDYGISLPENADIKEVDDNKWQIEDIDRGQTYIVKKEDRKLNISAKLVKDIQPGQLVQLPIADLRQDAEPVPWGPGDVLQLKLAYPSNELPDLEIYLEVRIVETLVIPAPEAAYALLRWQHDKSQVECVRFAWRPNASRVELVCAEDLRTEVVRRRAVFQWRDSVRPTTLNGYAIQKIAMNGSTHFPSPVED
jgi:hypothetical protein